MYFMEDEKPWGKYEEFIELQDSTIRKQRNNVLVYLGLCEKEYAPNNEYSEKYPLRERVGKWEEIMKKAEAIKQIKQDELGMSEEKPYTKALLPIAKNTAEKAKSMIAGLLRIAAWIIFAVGAIAGLTLGVLSENVLPFAIGVFSGEIVLLLFYALGSVLDHLTEISTILRNGFGVHE